jgi:hypothetical protein
VKSEIKSKKEGAWRNHVSLSLNYSKEFSESKKIDEDEELEIMVYEKSLIS